MQTTLRQCGLTARLEGYAGASQQGGSVSFGVSIFVIGNGFLVKALWNFPEVAHLLNVCWFEVTHEIELSLPPGAYTLTWRLFLGDLRGWHNEPAHFSFTKNDDESTECKCHIDPRPAVSSQPVAQFRLPAAIRVIETGWTENDVAEFSVARGETFSLKFFFIVRESRGWKSGLYLDGVDIRPTEVVKQIPSTVPTLPLLQGTLPTPEDPEVPFTSVRRFFTDWPNLGKIWRR